MLKKRIDSFKYAFKGVATLFKTQPNAIIHAIAAITVVCAGFYFNISSIEWGLLTLAIAGVISAEAFNTALEFLTDLVSPEYHELAGKTKDVAAAGVLIMAIGAAILGFVIFYPKIFG